MDRNTFKVLVDARLEECKEILGVKGAAYAGSKDVLRNFKSNAERLGITPYQVWAIYANKHFDTIINAISTTPSYPVDASESMQGRIKDSINYLLLLDALLSETAKKE